MPSMKIIITIENEEGAQIGYATSTSFDAAINELVRFENHPELLVETIEENETF